MSYSVAVIIVSDRAAGGTRDDACLPLLKELLADSPFEIVDDIVTSDDPDDIDAAFQKMLAGGFNLILTSGGTGCSERDNTPDVTRKFLTKPTPGLDEAIRAYSREIAPMAVFSRAVSGVAGRSFIINLPGSPKAVQEIIRFILPLLEHPLRLVAGQVTDCIEGLGHGGGISTAEEKGGGENDKSG